jgi:hypothetical protein
MKPTDLGIVLLDVAPGEGEVFEASFLEKIGHPVRVCHGPAAEEPCPLVVGEACEKFEMAHGVVFELDLDRPQHREIVDRYRAIAGPEMPIRVVVQPGQAERYREFLGQVEVWDGEPTVVDLDGFAAEVEAVDRQRE